MRAPLLLTALALAACSQAPAEPADPWSPGAHDYYNLLISRGVSPAEAKRTVDEAVNFDNSRYAPRAAKRQAEIQQVRKDACKNDPSISYC